MLRNEYTPLLLIIASHKKQRLSAAFTSMNTQLSAHAAHHDSAA